MNMTEDSNQQTPRSLFNYAVPSPQWNQVTPPWNQGPPHYMPWGHNPAAGPPPQLITFTAQPPTSPYDTNVHPYAVASTNQMLNPFSSIPQTVSQNAQPANVAPFGNQANTSFHCKRKYDLDVPIPSKQHITEEKMAAHMSRLHISSETPVMPPNVEEPADREKRLYMCEEMRKLQTDTVIPSVLLGRLQSPCMAVMLWQPPSKLPVNLHGEQNRATQTCWEDEDENARNGGNNNNNVIVDLNNMDMDA